MTHQTNLKKANLQLLLKNLHYEKCDNCINFFRL